MRFQNIWSSIRIISLVLIAGAYSFTALAQEAADARPVLDTSGNKVFTRQELLDVANQCLDHFTQSRPYETQILDHCLHQLRSHMQQKGYLQATLGRTLYEQNENVLKATIPISEGPLYRVGEIKIEDARVFAPAQILNLIGLNPGDVADGAKLSAGLYERVKEAYGNQGYIQYTAELQPEFHVKEGADEGVADFLITVDEGPQFKIRSIKFQGSDKTTTELLRRELMVRDGEVYNSDLFKQSIIRINNTGLFALLDADKDVDLDWDQKNPLLDITIRLKKREQASGSH